MTYSFPELIAECRQHSMRHAQEAVRCRRRRFWLIFVNSCLPAAGASDAIGRGRWDWAELDLCIGLALALVAGLFWTSRVRDELEFKKKWADLGNEIQADYDRYRGVSDPPSPGSFGAASGGGE